MTAFDPPRDRGNSGLASLPRHLPLKLATFNSLFDLAGMPHLLCFFGG
ncbi:MAG: hypothetical protein IRY89_09210 [Pseudolabrys sp.]|nr:hypothetical protein [Pseudolabrys sp.]